uniref:Leucine-rich repeat-containing protein 58 n=1 Tax=Rhabditophanes sp. KR3021 TaxID=114890 RepID=A0AC35TZ75_9BILA
MEFLESSPSTSNVIQYLTADLSDKQLQTFDKTYIKKIHRDLTPERIECLIISRNLFEVIPLDVFKFVNLRRLEVCELSLRVIPEEITTLSHLRHLDIRNNCLQTIPKFLSKLGMLNEINISGNEISTFPEVLFELNHLNTLHLGDNRLEIIPRHIDKIKKLKVLYLGGNRLAEIPDTIGALRQLTCLVLCDNQLTTLPQSLAGLQNLQRLSLHNNLIRTLPPQIIKLENLHSLSLRNNPLVRKFVDDMAFSPPSLMEIAGRAVRKNIPCNQINHILPSALITYLNSAHECVNPHCGGVYFEARFEHIKFVDFCGMYKVPLLQYLCSPKCGCGCSDNGPHVVGCHNRLTDARMKKVLLG